MRKVDTGKPLAAPGPSSAESWKKWVETALATISKASSVDDEAVKTTFVPVGTLTSTDVQGALAEIDTTATGLQSAIDAVEADVSTLQTDVGDLQTDVGDLQTDKADIGTLVDVQLITASGTYTPAAGVTQALVVLQAAGGGGGGVGTTAGTGRGGAAGAGETRAGVVAISGNVTVTLGAAGTGGSAGNNAGGTASDSTFGSSITAKGGTGGGGSTGATDGSNGTTPTGSGGIRLPPTRPAQNTANRFHGGCTIFGDCVDDNQASNHTGADGQGYGAGGCGAYDTGTTSRAGGDGAGAMCLVLGFR